MIKMLYTMNADRVSVLEMHNGKENPTGLPFKYCDMTYEETMDSIHYVSEEYEDINMSRFKFPDYLYKHRYFVGSPKELYDIDKKLAMKLESNDVQYFGIIILKNSQEIGFLMVSYNDIPSNIENHDIHILLSDYAQEIGYYLDLTEHI